LAPSQAKRDIEDKKKELRDARVVRQHVEEYEVRYRVAIFFEVDSVATD
jgi:hypothetical protein